MAAYHQIRKDKEHGNRKYGREHAERWREQLREQRISKAELSRRIGVSYNTMDRVLEEFAYD